MAGREQSGCWGSERALLPNLMVHTQVCSLHKNSSSTFLCMSYFLLKSLQKHVPDLQEGRPMHPIRIFSNKAQRKAALSFPLGAFI